MPPLAAVVVGAGFGVDVGAGAWVPTAVTSVTGCRVISSPETVRPTSMPPLVRTNQVTVLLPSRPAVRTTVLPLASAPSSTVCLVNGMATTSVTVVATSASVVAVRVGVDVVVVEELGADVVVVERAVATATGVGSTRSAPEDVWTAAPNIKAKPSVAIPALAVTRVNSRAPALPIRRPVT